MEQKNADRILKAIDDQFPIKDLKNWDEARDYIDKTFRWVLENLRNRLELRKMFLELPEPTPGELEEMVYLAEHLVGIVRRLVVDFVKEEIPHDPGGRPQKQGNPEEQLRRIRQAASLIEKGLRTTAALKRVASKENLSLSTMQRIWRNRKTLGSSNDDDAAK